MPRVNVKRESISGHQAIVLHNWEFFGYQVEWIKKGTYAKEIKVKLSKVEHFHCKIHKPEFAENADSSMMEFHSIEIIITHWGDYRYTYENYLKEGPHCSLRALAKVG